MIFLLLFSYSILPLAFGATAAISDQPLDISSLLILSIKDVPGAAETAAFEDDIEDPLPPGMHDIEAFIADELHADTHISGALSQTTIPEVTGGSPEDAQSEVLADVPSHSSAQLGGEATDPIGDRSSPTQRPPVSQKQRNSSSHVPSNQKGSGARIRKPMKVLGFSEAQIAFKAALKAPDVPRGIGWFVGRATSMKEPTDAVHSSYLAGLLQVATYAFQCVGEFRRLRRFDKGKAMGSIEEIQTLRRKNTRCMTPIKIFLSETKARLGDSLRQRGTQGGWDTAAELLDALYVYAIAMERNFAALTNYMEANANPKTPSAVLAALKEEREEARNKYEAAKAATKAKAKACEKKGIIPRSFPLLK